MAEYVQAVGSALAVTDALMTAANRVKEAKRVLGDIAERAIQIHTSLNSVKGTLDKMELSLKPVMSPNEYDKLSISIIVNVKAVGNALDKSFGLSDGKGQLQSQTSIVERLKVAANERRIQKDRDTLDSLIALLHMSISNVNTRLQLEQLGSRETAAPSQGPGRAFQDALKELSKNAQRYEERINVWKGGLDSQESSAQEEPEHDDLEKQAMSDVVKNLRSQTDLAFDFYERHRSDPEATASTSGNFRGEMFSRDSSQLEMSTLRFHSHPDVPPDMVPGTDKGATPGLELRDAAIPEGNVPSRTTLDGWILAALQGAEHHHDLGNWQQAEEQFSEVIQCSDLREREYRVPFENQTEMHQQLALVYLQQRKWSQAIAEIAQLQRRDSCSSGLDHHVSTADEKLSEAQLHHIRALIHYDRYLKGYRDNRDHRVPAKEQDLEAAERFGQAASGICERLLDDVPSRNKTIQQYRECSRLLIKVYESREKYTRVEFYRARLEEFADEGLILRPRRGTDISELIDSFDLEDAQREPILEAVKTGNSDAAATLHDAITASDTTLISRLLDPKGGALDINVKDAMGSTALHHAVGIGNHEMVHFLLRRDADVNCENNNQETPLLIAINDGQAPIAQDLIDHGAKVDLTHGDDDWSLLHYSVRNRSADITKLLLKRSPDLCGARDVKGKTPLHHCAERSGNVESLTQAEMLLAHGADANGEDYTDEKRTPLYLAVSKPYTTQQENFVILLRSKLNTIDTSRLPNRWMEYPALR